MKVTQYRRFMSSFDGVLPYDVEFFNLRAMKFVNFSMGLNNRSRREAADGGETQRRDSEAGLGRSSYIEHHQTCSEDFRRQTSACSARRQRGCHQFAATSKYVLRFCAPLAYHFILLLLETQLSKFIINKYSRTSILLIVAMFKAFNNLPQDAQNGLQQEVGTYCGKDGVGSSSDIALKSFRK